MLRPITRASKSSPLSGTTCRQRVHTASTKTSPTNNNRSSQHTRLHHSALINQTKSIVRQAQIRIIQIQQRRWSRVRGSEMVCQKNPRSQSLRPPSADTRQQRCSCRGRRQQRWRREVSCHLITSRWRISSSICSPINSPPVQRNLIRRTLARR